MINPLELTTEKMMRAQAWRAAFIQRARGGTMAGVDLVLCDLEGGSWPKRLVRREAVTG